MLGECVPKHLCIRGVVCLQLVHLCVITCISSSRVLYQKQYEPSASNDSHSSDTYIVVHTGVGLMALIVTAVSTRCDYYHSLRR